MTGEFPASVRRHAAVLVLGFASGLPLALTGQAMQAWLTIDGVDIATIGFFSLVGLPYVFKFLWAPLMDRFEPPFLGRRRGWVVLSQLAIAAALALMATFSPRADAASFALVAALVAFLSASQDVVVDAYRTDVLREPERGLGASLSVFGYRLAMVLSGGIALIWADAAQGFGWSWPRVYLVMAAIMLGLAIVSLVLLPPVPQAAGGPRTAARNELVGFIAIVAAVAVGYQVTNRIITPLAAAAFGPLSSGQGAQKWIELAALLAGIAFTLPLAWWAAKLARFETLNRSLAAYFSQRGAAAFLLLIVLYKLGDAFAGSLTTPFLIRAMDFAQAEVGVVNKVIGIWMTILGALAGGALMMWLGLFRALLTFGVLQLLSNFGFYLVATLGKGAWGAVDLPAFDWLIVSLSEATRVDYLLLSAVAVENVTGGMGTAALVAFLMALCNHRFTATQYALLSALAAVGRVWVGPMSGVLSEALGWPNFFLLSVLLALPGLALLVWLRRSIDSLSAPAPGTDRPA